MTGGPLLEYCRVCGGVLRLVGSFRGALLVLDAACRCRPARPFRPASPGQREGEPRRLRQEEAS